VFVKVDGVTGSEDAVLAASAGADAVGFVFAGSSRQVAPSLVREVVPVVPNGLLTVGVFVDESPARVVEIVQSCGLDAAQLHGRETPSDARWIRSRIGTVFKAFSAGSPGLAQAADYGADAVIVDSPVGGGSGQAYDWLLASQLPPDLRLILAGGLTPDNVAEAIDAAWPWGVDVASGVEREPGIKDPNKIVSFIEAARRAGDVQQATREHRRELRKVRREVERRTSA
jgi:phosphoribosylanthranilate isomerase